MTDRTVPNLALHHPPGDDSSQDPAQPAVGPAIQFTKLVVPDDQAVDTTPPPPGEIIDRTRAEQETEQAGR